ncbi:MAG: DHH family phosphoesterase [Clostridia bacterium]|nr:DHH family phosphoesterase [Clostridia bacterium]
MSKNSKDKNDLRRIRQETGIACTVSGAVFLGAFAALSALTKINTIAIGIVLFLLHAGVCVGAYFLFEKKARAVAVDEKLAPVMGRIMFDAVVKMNNPVFICDSSERVIWFNQAMEALYPEKGRLYGNTITSLCGITLTDIRNDRSNAGARFEIGSRSFCAKYNHIKTEDDDFALIITSETTELDALNEKIAGDEAVVCYIIIDNLGEMMQYDSEQYRPASSKIDEILRSWADEYGGILKEYERDKYLFITENRALHEMIIQKFDILDRVRGVTVGDTNLPLTISMGVSAIHGTFEEKERAAHAALDMALQRGGDQAAVKSDDSMEFFGGVTKTVQKRTNVRARVVSNALMAAMKQASNVLIMGHKYADFDAFGSCVGLAKLAMFCGAKVNVIIDPADRNLLGCRQLLANEAEFSGVFIDASRGLDLLETGTLVIMSDVNNIKIAEEPELANRTDNLAVIDHHRKVSEFEREPDVEYIEPSASAACELVAEMLEQVLQKDDLSAAVASVMLAGITLDTKQFTKNTGTRTFSAAMYLRDRGADPTAVRALFRESFDDYKREARFRGNVEIYRGVCAITIVDDINETDGGYRIIAAKAADNLLMVDGVKASFAVTKLGEVVHISARSAGGINVQLIMEEMGGGGHFDGAAAQIREQTMDEIIQSLKRAIDKIIG